MSATGRDLVEAAGDMVGEFKRLQKEGLICLDGDFFPSVHYPPITMYDPITEDQLFEGYANPSDGLFDIYVHIPFCIQHCTFCHYPVRIGDQEEEKVRYMQALEKEIDIYMRRLGLEKIKARSILIGGGTPTYLSPDRLEIFLKFLTSRLDLAGCTQITYDVDPPTILGPEGAQRLDIMKAYGATRLTIGVQSLDDRILRHMNRPHNAAEAIKAIEASASAGFTNNIEFIYGYPGETLENWIETMTKAVSLGAEEIQLYRLKIDPYGDFEGPIKKLYSKHSKDFPEPERAIMMKKVAHSVLELNGYKENLRRVFSKKREEYSHYADNQCCKLYDEIGFGLTAFSSLRDRFGLNTQNFKEYYNRIEKGRMPINRGLVRSPEDQIRWCIVLPLKHRGVYKNFFKIQTGVSLDEVFRDKIERLKKFDLVTEDDKVLKLTDLGAFFADEVCQQFHDPRYMPFPKDAYAHGELYPYDENNP